MPYSLPDKGEGENDVQSILFQQDIELIASGQRFNGDFVQSGCAVTAQGTPNMTVAVASGVVYSNRARLVVTGANGTVTAADGTNPRLDYVVINSAGAIAVRAGTAAANPKPPDRTANDVVLAQVYIPAAATTITTARITDRRITNDHIVTETIEFPTIANPATPAADTMLVYARKVSGRMVPKWISPSGIDTPFQAAIWGNNLWFYSPGDGTTIGVSPGGLPTSGGTVSHPTPTAGAYLQTKRSRWANVVTTTNQQLGLIQKSAAQNSFWTGNAAGLGGFFFFARFGIGLWPAATVRLFVGLTSLTSHMCATDTPSGDFIGLWHDTGDAATVLSFIHMDGTTRVKTAIASTPTLVANQGFDFYMFCKPNDTTIYYRLDDLNAGTTIVDTSIATNVPRSTIFMGPQAEMSNGTANTTVTTTAFELNRLYVESDH